MEFLRISIKYESKWNFTFVNLTYTDKNMSLYELQKQRNKLEYFFLIFLHRFHHIINIILCQFLKYYIITILSSSCFDSCR